MSQFKIAEFCSGTGAFSLGFHLTNKTTTIFANDYEPASKKIFDINFNIPLTLLDIHDLDIKNIPSMDILTSGFPCQPFSISGIQKGFDDPRSNVFFTLLKIIEYHQPKCIVFENVKNLITHDNSKTFDIIIYYQKLSIF